MNFGLDFYPTSQITTIPVSIVAAAYSCFKTVTVIATSPITYIAGLCLGMLGAALYHLAQTQNNNALDRNISHLSLSVLNFIVVVSAADTVPILAGFAPGFLVIHSIFHVCEPFLRQSI